MPEYHKLPEVLQIFKGGHGANIRGGDREQQRWIILLGKTQLT